MPSFHPPHDDLVFMSPLSDARAARLVRFLAGVRGGTVLDVGCGWGELLLRTVASEPAVRGVGIDSDEVSVAHGRVLARARGLADRVEFVEGDARSVERADVTAVICIGASQIWGTDDGTSRPLDYTAALTALRELVPRGGRVVYGEGFWATPPTDRATAPLGGRDDEYVALPVLVELAVSCGFAVRAVHEASLDEWDEFESGFGAAWAWWLAEHGPDHPDAAQVAERAARQRAGYLGGYRGVLGLAYLELLAV